MTNGERIRKAREDAGYSQSELAAKLGISKQLVYKYEKDIVTNIPLERIGRIADLCGVTPAYLTGWDEGLAGKAIVLDIYDQLSETKRNMVIRYMQFLQQME